VAWLLIALLVATLMQRAYAGHVLPGTSLAGQDISGLALDQLDPLLSQIDTQTTISITVDGQQVQASGVEIGASLDRQAIIAQLAEASGQTGWVFSQHPVKQPLLVNLDPTTINQWLINHFPGSFQAAVDAAVVFNNTTGQFETDTAVAGAGVNQDQLERIKTVLASTDGQVSISLTADPLAPDIRDDQANQTRDWLNQKLTEVFTLTTGESSSYQLSSADLLAMIRLRQGPSDQALASFDQQLILDRLRSTIAPAMGADGIAEKVLVDAQGTVLDQLQPGQEGLALADLENLAATLQTSLTDRSGASIPVTMTAADVTPQTFVAQEAPSTEAAAQVDYLLTYATDYNVGQWGDYNPYGGDCANFASQGLIARGIPMDSTWLSRGPHRASTAWTLSTAMDAWMKNKGWDRLEMSQLDQLSLGDVGVFDWNANGNAEHIMTVSRIAVADDGSRLIYFASHNDDGPYRLLDQVMTEQHPGAAAWFYSVP
jgi:hypothetical protein